MAFLITVLISHLAWVFLKLIYIIIFIIAIVIKDINPDGWNETFNSSFLNVVVTVFFFWPFEQPSQYVERLLA